MLSTLLLATGPILLFRLELLVGLLVLIAWCFHKKNNPWLAGIFLGLAISTKLYPIVIWPIMAAQYLLFSRKRDSLSIFIATTLLGISITLVPFLATNHTFDDVRDSMAYYQYKPVGPDSIWGNIIILNWKFQYKEIPPIDSNYGIRGLDSMTTNAPLSFFNYFWILPTAIITIMLLWLRRHSGYTDPVLPLIILTVFVLSSKIINPQYLWWFVSFLPFIVFNKIDNKWHVLAIVTALIALALTQVIYPIYYAEVIAWQDHRSSSLFTLALSLLRNVSLIVFLASIIMMTLKRTERLRTEAPSNNK